MSINKNNYETFLIDYLDGKLPAVEVSEVLLFLEQNPDIKTEFEGVAAIQISQEELVIDFSSLHKPIFDAVKKTYEPLLVAQLEGELTDTENAELQKGVGLYPELKHEVFLFNHTKLSPDFSVVFANKQELKKGGIFIVHRNTLLRVAAILLLFSVVGISVVRLTQNSTSSQTATIKNPVIINNNIVKHPTINPSANSNTEHLPLTPKGHLQTQHNHTIATQTIQKQNPTTFAHLESKANGKLAQMPKQETDSLVKTKDWIAYQKPLEPTTPNDFVDFRTFVRNTLHKSTQHLENKTLAALSDMNKTAGISVQKDSTTGKVVHVEIVALGIEWSQSK